MLHDLVEAYENTAPYMPEHKREDVLRKLMAIRDDLGDEISILQLRTACNV